jgi:hypothetical protein
VSVSGQTSGGADMKKQYAKPALTKEQKLVAVVAVTSKAK